MAQENGFLPLRLETWTEILVPNSGPGPKTQAVGGISQQTGAS